MPSGQVSFVPPPQVRGVSASPPAQNGQDGLMQQLAQMTGRDKSQTQLAGPVLAQGLSLLRQAAQLDPRIAPLIEQALSAFEGGKAVEKPHHASRSRSGGGNMLPSPGGAILP